MERGSRRWGEEQALLDDDEARRRLIMVDKARELTFA
jgi:hypothetical protein